jgi:cupin
MRGDAPTADMIDIADAGVLPFHINLMNGGAISAKLVCGYLACDSRPFNPLLEALPPMLKAGDPRKNDAGWGLASSSTLRLPNWPKSAPAGESVLTKLSETHVH